MQLNEGLCSKFVGFWQIKQQKVKTGKKKNVSGCRMRYLFRLSET